MVSTITPLVREAPRKWITTVAVFCSSAVAGGAITGAIVGTLGALTEARQTPLFELIAGIGILLGLAELSGLAVPLPTLHRSVPQSWWRQMPWLAAAGLSGLSLGSGMTTVIRFPGYHVLLAFAFVCANPAFGAVIFAAYAGGRAAPVLLAGFPVLAGMPVGELTDSARSLTGALHSLNGVALCGFCVLLLRYAG